MKKVLLIAMALCISALAYSQKDYQLTKQQKDFSVQLTKKGPISEELPFNNVFDPTVSAVRTLPEETVIGNTWYDFQTNQMISGRIYQHSDGTIGGVWTMGFDAPAFDDRGSGYNYFDGVEWGDMPEVRIEEDVRCGWPNYGPLGLEGEVVISHDGVSGLQVMTREVKGTGEWNQIGYVGEDATWPRIAVGGEENDVIHLIYATGFTEYLGQNPALLYSRSFDGGETWDPKDHLFDEFSLSYYTNVGGDGYTIAASGDIVAILIADTWSSDIAMLKSVDGGETWSNTIIWEHPYPFYDWNTTITDTFFATDGTAGMAIGPDGKVHVVFGLCRVLHDVVGNNYTLWPGAEGIVYWNEDMPVFSNSLHALSPPDWGYEDTELVYDYNLIGWMQDVNGNGQLDLLPDYFYYRTIGLSGQPAITVDENNEVFVVYSSVTEGYDNSQVNYRHLWGRALANNEWGPFSHLTYDIIHIFDECIWPVLSPTSDDMNLHMLYNVDQIPGTGLDADHDYVQNSLFYSAIPKTDLLTGIRERPALITAENVSQNYPNPFTGMTTITVNLLQQANLSLEVSNLLGQQVMKIDRGNVSAGGHQFQLDGSKLQQGIYFYTVKANGSAVTKKMIVR